MKKTPIPPRPPSQQAADAWIGGATEPTATSHETRQPAAPAGEETKRLTLDIPKSLHKAFKALCADADTTMVNDITHYIKQRVASNKGGDG